MAADKAIEKHFNIPILQSSHRVKAGGLEADWPARCVASRRKALQIQLIESFLKKPVKTICWKFARFEELEGLSGTTQIWIVWRCLFGLAMKLPLPWQGAECAVAAMNFAAALHWTQQKYQLNL